MVHSKPSQPINRAFSALSAALLALGCGAAHGDEKLAPGAGVSPEDTSAELRRFWWRPRLRPILPPTGGTGMASGGTTSKGGTGSGGTSTGGTGTAGTATGGSSAFGVAVKFKPPSAPDVLGFLQDVGDVFGSRGNGHSYGWNVSHTERGSYTEHIPGQGWAFPTWSHVVMLPSDSTTWEIVVPSGTYSVLVQGHCDEGGGTPPQRIEVENQLVVDFVPKVGCYDVYTAYASRVVSVSDGRLTVTNGDGATANAIEYITITKM